MQALVYSFMALAAAGIGALAYFALAFTPANAVLVALVVGCVCFCITERSLRLRAEKRLEHAIQELSRLLATDAQAGQVLGQRINAITDMKLGQRADMLEADISVLGTVIRQVAEAVAELEERVDRPARRPAAAPARDYIPVAPPPPVPVKPRSAPKSGDAVMPLADLRQAMSDNRLAFYVQPIVRLPQRRPAGYDLLPRIELANGEFAEEAAFMPTSGGDDIVREIEGTALFEAVAIARRARTNGQTTTLYIPLSRSTLSDPPSVEQLMATLDANRAIASSFIFVLTHDQWSAFDVAERAAVEAINRKGAGFSLSQVWNLRIDVAELASLGVRSLRVDAASFIADPQAFTDFHMSDVASYLNRFEMALIATGISGEREIVELLDNDILLVRGEHVGPAVPMHKDLALDPARNPAPRLRRAEI